MIKYNCLENHKYSIEFDSDGCFILAIFYKTKLNNFNLYKRLQFIC